MNELRLKVTANKLEAQNEVFTTSGSANFDTCIFSFDTAWNNFTKYALFTFGNDDCIKVDIVDNRCNIPSICLRHEGILRISVFGVNNSDVVITTNNIAHKVEEGVYDVEGWLEDDG